MFLIYTREESPTQRITFHHLLHYLSGKSRGNFRGYAVSYFLLPSVFSFYWEYILFCRGYFSFTVTYFFFAARFFLFRDLFLFCGKIFLLFFSFFLSFPKILHSFFYTSYVSICMDLQKTIVLSSGPFLQIFTFTIQCICSLWWIESSPSEAIPYTQKHDSNKAAAMHLCWNHTTAWVPPPPVDSPHMP